MNKFLDGSEREAVCAAREPPRRMVSTTLNLLPMGTPVDFGGQIGDKQYLKTLSDR